MNEIPRQGRIRRGFGALKLPEMHVETGGNIPKSITQLPPNESDPIWDLPNTFAMMRCDIRKYRNPADSNEWYIAYPPPNEVASDIANIMVETYRQRFEARFAAIGKPLKYALLIVGLDSDANSRFISRDPQDGYVWPPPGGDANNSSILIRKFGPQETRDFFAGDDGIFIRLKVNLDAHQPTLPFPSMCLCNFESRGDVGGTGPYGLTGVFYSGFPSPGNGFVESRIANDPDAMLTRSQTLAQWFVSRTLTQNFATFDPFDPLVTTDVSGPILGGSAVNPINRESLLLATAAVTASYADGLALAVYEPFREAFGPLPCGDWEIYAADQYHQTPLSPRANQHFLGAIPGHQLQIPATYGGLPQLRDNNAPAFANDNDWDTIWHWLNAYQPAGYFPPSTYPVNDPGPGVADDRFLRLMVQVHTKVARQCRLADPDAALMPSVGLNYYTEQEVAAATPYFVRYMLNCCDLGAQSFYVFAPSWNTGAGGLTGQQIRTRHYHLVRDFNNAFRARIPYRNRMFRFGA
jgi:hypothetical protein